MIKPKPAKRCYLYKLDRESCGYALRFSGTAEALASLEHALEHVPDGDLYRELDGSVWIFAPRLENIAPHFRNFSYCAAKLLAAA